MTRGFECPATAVRARLPRGAGLLLAVSGGLDSTTLLRACCDAQRECGWRLVVGHVDHRLRPESANDAVFVRELAHRHSLPFVLETLNPDEVRGQNIEAWARAARYRFFASIRQEHGLDWIVTAHSADDAAETLLMRLVSNREPRGIARRDERRMVLRPLLSVTRAEIERYAAAHGVQHRIDVTNSDLTLLRNRVRHELLPYLRKLFDPRMSEVLAERAMTLEDDMRALRLLALETTREFASLPFGSKEWKRRIAERLETLPESLQWRVVELILEPLVGFEIGQRGALRALSVLRGEHEGAELLAGYQLRLQDGGIVLTSPSAERGQEQEG